MSADANLVRGDPGGHVRRLAVPASVGFFFMILFNVVDTVVAGFIDTNAQAGLAFAFPLFFMVIAVSAGIARASAGMIARARGARLFRRGRYYCGQAAAYCLGVGMLLMAVGWLCSDGLLSLLVGDTDNARAQHGYALEYTLWMFAAAPLFNWAALLSGVLSANGNTKTYRNAIIATTLLNIVLDPVLAFGWLGLPALGMTGIALATITAQAVQIAIMLPAAARLSMMAGFRRIFFAPRRAALAHIAGQATPVTLQMLSTGIGFMIITYYLARLDDFAVAAYGIAIRIEQLLLIHTIGLSQALLAVGGQSFGAGLLPRVVATYRTVLKYGAMLSLGAIAIMLGAGRQLIWLFNRDAHIIELGYQYLLVAAVLSLSYVVAHSSAAVMQAVGRPTLIGPLGALRLIVLPLVFCQLLVEHLGWGIAGVWTSLALANLIVTAMLFAIATHMVRGAAPVAQAA